MIFIIVIHCSTPKGKKCPDGRSAYYSRQLYLYNFAITHGSSGVKETKSKTFIYSWTEVEFNKNANIIASFVYDHLTKMQTPEEVTTIQIFCDGCPGQNKNTMMMGMLMKLLLCDAPSHVTDIHVIFPVPRHSFMPPDCIFGHIEKKIKVNPTITEVGEYRKIASDFDTVITLPDFTIYDWKMAISKVVKPPEGWPCQFQKMKRFKNPP